MKKGILAYIIVLLLFSCEKPIDDFQSHNFVKFFGNGYESAGADVIRLSDDTYVLTGYDVAEEGDKQILCVKTDQYGNYEWVNTYGSSTVSEQGAVVKSMDDGYLFAGVSVTGSLTNSFLLKTGTSGDSLWCKKIGDAGIDIEIKDLVVGLDGIYVAGKSYQAGNIKSDYYIAKLSLDGELDWEWSYGIDDDSYFCSVVLSGTDVLCIGFDGITNTTSIQTVKRSDGLPRDSDHLSGIGESPVDARMIGGSLTVLVNNTGYSKLLKLDTDYSVAWETEDFTGITGKAITEFTSGSILLLGEIGNGISTIVVDDGGATSSFGSNDYRTISGSVSRVRKTGDGGIIFIGSTNATFGTKAQLIKTGEGLFLLKP